MGLLDSSTNNIIVDAVLTSRGRELLARNDGSFSISSFALGDDEVDYEIIKKYGRTVGKEKISKNTLIFEALTDPESGLRHKLISASVPTLTKIPGLSITGVDASTNTVSLSRSTTSSTTTNQADIIIKQVQGGGGGVPNDLVGVGLLVEMDYRILSISGLVPEAVSDDNIARYLVVKDAATLSGNRAKFTFTINAKNISDDFYNSLTNSTLEQTIVMTEQASGAQASFIVSIS